MNSLEIIVCSFMTGFVVVSTIGFIICNILDSRKNKKRILITGYRKLITSHQRYINKMDKMLGKLHRRMVEHRSSCRECETTCYIFDGMKKLCQTATTHKQQLYMRIEEMQSRVEEIISGV